MTARVLLGERQLRNRVRELGVEIAHDYADSSDPPVFVGVLKGSAIFLADLARSTGINLTVDFMSISSYGDSRGPSGVVRIVKDLDQGVTGRDVLVVEDIVDTGLTLSYLRRTLMGREPRSLRVVTLLDKSVRRIVPAEIDYVGFDVPDVFALGYGLDYQGLYRNSRRILAVTEMDALKRDPLALRDLAFGADPS